MISSTMYVILEVPAPRIALNPRKCFSQDLCVHDIETRQLIWTTAIQLSEIQYAGNNAEV